MTGNPVGMRRVNVERARRMVARTAAASADVERRWWIASMTPEHRAVHEREYLPGFGCSFCINDAMARAAETMRRTMATGGSYGPWAVDSEDYAEAIYAADGCYEASTRTFVCTS